MDEKDVAYTLVNSGDGAKFAPNVVRAMVEAGQGDNISNSYGSWQISLRLGLKEER